MGMFEEYIKKQLSGPALDAERKSQLSLIGQLRGTVVISYAARLTPTPVPIEPAILYEDVLPFSDLLENLDGKRVSVILETPGGIGEVGRQIVEMLHERFEWVEFIVPGMAMSTGTIMCLGGHEIWMGPSSALGPIDAQLLQDGKRYSADALIEGFNEIKKDVIANNGQLNPAYIPILQRISPGELQGAHNALEFARATVTDWLARYKFANWEKEGVPVTEEHKKKRAREIAENLAKQSLWHTHGRSLRIDDLRSLGLKVRDLRDEPKLYEAVQRYYVLTRLTFEQGPVYKIYETTKSTIARHFQAPVSPAALQNIARTAEALTVEVGCAKCGHKRMMQIDFSPGQMLQPGTIRFPNQPRLPCPQCNEEIRFDELRGQIEQQVGRKALNPQPES